MGMDLRGAGGCWRASIWTWEMLIEDAKLFGWIPAGTLPPRWVGDDGSVNFEHSVAPSAWCGSYHSNDCQRVSAEDARAWAEALERAIRSGRYRDRGPIVRCKIFYLDPDDPEFRKITAGPVSERDRELFTRALKGDLDAARECRETEVSEFEDHVRDFCRFCRAGEFAIG